MKTEFKHGKFLLERLPNPNGNCEMMGGRECFFMSERGGCNKPKGFVRCVLKWKTYIFRIKRLLT